MLDDQRIKRLQNFSRPKFGSDMNCEGLAGIFIHYCQHFIGPAIAELVMYEVNRPSMIWIFRAQADHRCIFVVNPLALFVAGGQLQPFLAPKPATFL